MKFKICYPLNLPFHVTQKYGENLIPLYGQLGMLGHNGHDYSTAQGTGTPIYATHEGEVTYAGVDGSNGVIVVIKTLEAFEYKEGTSFFKTLYGHLKTGSVLVTVGQKVSKGQQIAQMNNTGASTGPHLHFGVKPILKGEQDWQWFNLEQDNGYNGAIDPNPYIDSTYPSNYAPRAEFALPEHARVLLQAAKDFQVKEGLLDFAGEKDLSKVRIGTKTLQALKKYQK